MRRRIAGLLLAGVLLWTACATPPTLNIQTPTAEPTTELDAPTSLPAEESGLLYLDATASVDDRVADLLSRMTLEEKVGQMAQVSMDCIDEEDIRDRFLGSMLSGGGGAPRPNNPGSWADMVDGYQAYALQTRLGIPLIYGVDAVHGHNNVYGAVIFPHNVGLGAANNPELMERIGQVTAHEMVATGIYWNFAPVVAVPQDIRWGRTYEGYSEDPAIVSSLSAAYIRGLQNVDGERDLAASTTVLATPKHFVGDGGTTWGTSTVYRIDQGVTEVDEATLREIHLAPYVTAIDTGAMSVMASFSSWQETKMHAHEYLLTTVLKEELGFEGFVVSDWKAIDQLSGIYYDKVVTAINAGIDLVMLPCSYDLFISALTGAVEQGDVPATRVDDAVRRILTAKVQMGLFERPFSNDALLEDVGSKAHREVARAAVRQSLVLLRNEDSVLPLDPNERQILLSGGGVHDVGMQCGGWTISWQGANGEITPGTTIIDAIESAVSADTTVSYDRFGRFEDVEGTAPLGIAVVGERPYAEGVGDDADLALAESDVKMLARIRQKVDRLVVIIISGRPLIVTDHLDDWDGVVAAWLPGTEAQGIADVLFGDYPFVGQLPYSWPRSAEQLPQGTLDQDAALFPLGHGLTTTAE